MSSVANENLVLLHKTSKMNNVSLQQTVNRIPRIKYRYGGSFPTLDNDTFTVINTQPSIMQDEHWIKIANSGQLL